MKPRPDRVATQVRFGGLGVPYSFDALTGFLQRTPGPGLDLLAGVAEAGKLIGQLDTHGVPPVTSTSLATAMAAVLTSHSIPADFGGSRPVRSLPPAFVDDLCHRALTVDDEDVPRDPDEWALLRLVIRVHGLQSLLQGDTMHEIARGAILAGTVAVPSLGLQESAAGDEMLRLHVGVGAEAYFAAMFGLWARASQHPFIHLPTFLRHFRFGTAAEEGVRAALHRHALTPEEARARLVSPEFRAFRGSSRAFALFSEHPFLKVGPDYFLSAPHPFVRLAARSSLFFATKAAARRPEWERVRHAIGERFVRYTHGLALAAAPGADIWDTHGVAEPQGLPDIVLGGGVAGWVMLVEVKARTPPPTVLVGSSSEQFRQDFNDMYPKWLAQLIKAAWRLDTSTSTLEVGLVVRRARRIHLLALAPMVPAGLHLPMFRHLIEREAILQLPAGAAAWFAQARASGRFATWHVDGIEALEAFIARARGETLPEMLEQWLVDMASRAYGPDELPPTFRDYLAHRWSDRDGHSWEVVETAYREQMARVRSIFASALGVDDESAST